jgi:hypothetical protein
MADSGRSHRDRNRPRRWLSATTQSRCAALRNRVVSWAPGSYSLARFDLIGRGPMTQLVLDHTGFPAGNAEHLAAGWYANYWEPLRRALG